MTGAYGFAALVVLDGWGLGPKEGRANAVAAATTPNLDRLFAAYPWASLSASGEDVGLMAGQMGDSNVGHLNLGAGRVVYQYVLRITKAVRDGSFFQNPVILEAVRQAARKGTALHLMGLVSPGGVHSHTEHLYALLDLAGRQKPGQVLIHAFLDGRDVPPASAMDYVLELEERIRRFPGPAGIATVSGRYFAMDRDKRWDRVKKAYDAIVLGRGPRAASAAQAVREAYDRGETDEFVTPTVIGGSARGVPQGQTPGKGGPTGERESQGYRGVVPGDSVLFFNFRADRARQLSHAFVDEGFSGFPRDGGGPKVSFASMTRYEEDLRVPFAFDPQDMTDTLGEVVSRLGWRQLRIAETEKYAHVTFFFSGGREEPFPGETRHLVPSPKVATYDLKPEMSAFEVTDAVIHELSTGRYSFMVLNYANLDMVGHTGMMKAAMKAVEAVDTCVGRVVAEVQRLGGALIITSDHGNADEMVNPETGEPHTAHTLNPVPVILVSDRPGIRLRDGILADVAPTVLEVLGLPKPPAMTGSSLIISKEEGAS